MRPKRGAIFDWDGVIIDSSGHHETSWERLAAELGRELPPGHFVRGFGMKNDVIISELLRWTTDGNEIQKISLRKEELYRDVVRERGIIALPGVRTWLERLHAAGIPCAIGSSTHLENIRLSLKMLEFESFFSVIVTAEDVQRGKPDPEVFVVAANRLGVSFPQAVVFEDALVGLQAAHAGGMRVVAVTTTNSREQLAQADWIVDRLDELTIDGLWGK